MRIVIFIDSVTAANTKYTAVVSISSWCSCGGVWTVQSHVWNHIKTAAMESTWPAWDFALHQLILTVVAVRHPSIHPSAHSSTHHAHARLVVVVLPPPLPESVLLAWLVPPIRVTGELPPGEERAMYSQFRRARPAGRCDHHRLWNQGRWPAC